MKPNRSRPGSSILPIQPMLAEGAFPTPLAVVLLRTCRNRDVRKISERGDSRTASLVHIVANNAQNFHKCNPSGGKNQAQDIPSVIDPNPARIN